MVFRSRRRSLAQISSTHYAHGQAPIPTRLARPGFGAMMVIVATCACIIGFPTPAFALNCTPPSAAHATIQEAVNDMDCDAITLQAQPYPESILISRSLTLLGNPIGLSIIQGAVVVSGTSVEVTMQELHIDNGCPDPGLWVKQGAHVYPSQVEVRRVVLDCPPPFGFIFYDGFE